MMGDPMTDDPTADGPGSDPTADPGRRAAALAIVSHPEFPRVVRQIVGRVSRRCPHLRDEYESAAWLAAWEAALKYDDRHGISWTSFLWKAVTNALVSFRRRWNHERATTFDRSFEQLDDWSNEDEGGLYSEDGPVGWEMESEDATVAMIRMAPAFMRGTLRALFLECAEDRDEVIARTGKNFRAVKYIRRYGPKRIGERLRERGRTG